MKYLIIILLLCTYIYSGNGGAKEKYGYLKVDSKVVPNYKDNEMVIMDDTIRNITCYKIYGVDALTCVNRQCSDVSNPKVLNRPSNQQIKDWRTETFEFVTAKGYSIYYVTDNGDFSLVEKDGRIYLLEHRDGDSPKVTNERFLGFTDGDY